MNLLKEPIVKELRKIEKEKDITILFASEIGSRANGICNSKSDYDVGFIYKKNNLIDYLGTEKKQDVIEKKIKDKIEFTGWDIRKAVTLFKKKNYNIIEWINSPTIYINDWSKDGYSLKERFNTIYGNYCSGYTMLIHHSSLALNLLSHKKPKRLRNAIYSYLICENIINIGCDSLYDFSYNNMINNLRGIVDDKLLDLVFNYIGSVIFEEPFDKTDLLKQMLSIRLKEIRSENVKSKKNNRTTKIPKKERPPKSIYNDIIKDVLEL